ncbi:SsrA-binding protein [Rhodothalassium salexigens]|uniref:SsrA-binding protein n=1 Tax=Rhodothalassium salexigens DSM 2132 TaxID=1188247 RepID=A0A4R2PRF8_RHOSA|nr:SsrA-binding protein SmpB [Rhodothalassium salexigens]MBB4210288.1 SsrA-binding protein [Rhodothalassium salexigens DSM 2132]MBK1639197.1 SsrA-binding protein [Rhodothalassium salexigens DSM 2132]MBK5911719.1 SsrA-binding protein [Rhodothalassium salexigens]MBK5920494.1 SsrA-binding protein [Rhodothalassium salexigens]TCP38452.1 SsrA-binding protein [Rhodothalassium salexigens DSM 2132]
MTKKTDGGITLVADNRPARHHYHIEDSVEAGLSLQGTEVKSLREGKANIKESYAEIRDGEAWLINAHIPEFSHGNIFNHEPRRPRKLLLHRREIDKLGGYVQKRGYTLVPLRLYFNSKGIAKLALGLGKGKKQHDKREDEKKRDWEREKSRLLKEMG